MQVKIKKFHKDAVTPKQATEFAGGWDVTVTEIKKVEDDLVICKLGFALQLPKGYKLTLVPRSSLTKTHWVLQNSPGLGDCDYRGEFQLRFRGIPIGYEKNPFKNMGETVSNLTYEQFPFKIGDRVGQAYLEEVIPMEFKVVDELSETKRGEGGFGSTNDK